MPGWKNILIEVLTLTSEVKRLNQQTEKLSERTINIDKRMVRLETMVEIAKSQKQLPEDLIII